ncbi:MAG: hypothetical protein V2A66_06270 [Pseudomonadota bacterium]
MKNWRLAIIMNAFVMPGSGHVLVGLKTKGYLIGVLTIIFIFLPILYFAISVSHALQTLSASSNSVMPALEAISRAWVEDKRLILRCILALVFLWAYGIIDLMLKRKGEK